MEEKRTEIESLFYRMEKLDEKYKSFKWLLSGTEGSYLNLLLTKEGKLSGKAIDQMVGELTECLGEYRSYKKAKRSGFGIQMMPYHLTEKESVYYRSYFYLLLGFAIEQNSGPMERWCRPGTWDALIERVSYPITYRTVAELDRDIINLTVLGGALTSCPFRYPEGFFYDMLCAYRGMTGKDFMAVITEQEREAAYALMTADEQYLITHPEAREKREKEEKEELEQLRREMDGDGPEEAFPEEIYGELKDYLSGDAALPGGWKTFFTEDRERFVESCIIVRKQFCNNLAQGELEEEIVTAIHFYLYRKGLSKWRDDDVFFAVYTYLNKALKVSKKRLEKRMET